MGSKEPQPAPPSGLSHGFGEDWVCIYCGVTQEHTSPGDTCPRRPRPKSPQPPNVSAEKLKRSVRKSKLPKRVEVQEEELCRFDMSARDEIASEIFIQWMEDTGGLFEPTETYKKLAENAVIAANLFIAELEEAKR